MSSSENRPDRRPLGETGYAVHHFGPDPDHVGGIGSVMKVLVGSAVGGEKMEIHPTWATTHRRSARQTLVAAGAIAFRMGPRDIVHVHLSFKGSFIREGALLILARSLRRPTVATIHGSSFLDFARRQTTLVKAVLRSARVVTCLDPEVLELIRALHPRGLVELVPNPARIDDPPRGADSTDEIVLFAGEIGHRKGADVLVRAWSQIARRRPAARCVVVGPPGDLTIEPTDRLEVRGPVDSVAVTELLRACRVVALPSRAEAMPMILIEAMGCGRPFVSTPVGGIAELAAAGGELAPVGDSELLAARLEEFLAEPERAVEVGERGRAFCAETRGIEVIDARMRALYTAALRL